MAKAGAKITEFKQDREADPMDFKAVYVEALEQWAESRGKVIYLPFVRQEPNRWRQLLEVRTVEDIKRVMSLPREKPSRAFSL